TDAVSATYPTIVPYMRDWIGIVSKRHTLQKLLPFWFYGLFVRPALRLMKEKNGCGYPHLEDYLPRLAPRPLLMIHGGADTYIKPEMAEQLFSFARAPKELWMVEGAKHNQALKTAAEEYRLRVL